MHKFGLTKLGFSFNLGLVNPSLRHWPKLLSEIGIKLEFNNQSISHTNLHNLLNRYVYHSYHGKNTKLKKKKTFVKKI